MTLWNIAVVGATGQVGSALVELLQNQTFNYDKVCFISSDNNAGEIIRFASKNITTVDIENVEWQNWDIVFFAATELVSKQYVPIAAEAGCIVIDSSNSFIEQPNIPVVVPKYNDSVLADFRNENIIVVANPIVCQLIRTVASLTDIEQLSQLHITNFLPASFFGKAGVNELASQTARLLNGLPAEADFFDKQLAFNLLPHSQMFKHPSTLEASITEQIKRITNNYQLSISIDSVLSPVFYGFTQTVMMASAVPIDIDNYLDMTLFDHYDVELMHSEQPTPATEVNNDNEKTLTIKMANLRHSYGNAEQIQFYSVSDNIRYLGAKMLLETAEQLAKHYL